MKTQRFRKATAIFLTVCFSIISPLTAWAVNYDPWTTVGSAGTVDEADLSIFSFSGGVASVKSTATLPATLDIRYNVVSVDGLLNSLDGCELKVRYSDNGTNAQVIVKFLSYNIATGVANTLLTFDSNAFPQVAGYQLQSVAACWPYWWPLNFNNYAYFLEAQIIKTAAAGTPALSVIKLTSILC